jgi:hypothetical protein
MTSYVKNFIQQRDTEGLFQRRPRSRKKKWDICLGNAYLIVCLMVLILGTVLNMNYTVMMYDVNYDWYMTPCPLPLVTCQGSTLMGANSVPLPVGVRTQDVSECYLRNGFQCVTPYHYGIQNPVVSIIDKGGLIHHVALDTDPVVPFGHIVAVNESSSLFPNNHAVIKDRHIRVRIGELTFEGSDAICIQSAHALTLGFLDHPCT